MVHDELFGREVLVGRALTALAGHGSVLLFGPAGIGKSALADELVRRLDAERAAVLRATGSPREMHLPYVGLVDLFADAVDELVEGLPLPLRNALDVAFLRIPASESAIDPLALRLAVIELLRQLARRSKVVLVVDDLQWLDPASAQVLRFALQRLADCPVHVLATQRCEGSATPDARSLTRHRPVEIMVPALDRAVIGDLLRSRLGLELARSAITRLSEASDGNPLHALELARSLPLHGWSAPADRPLTVPPRLRALVADRLQTVSGATRRRLLELAVTVRPVRRSDELREAIEAGILIEEEQRVRFSHPLLAEVILADASPDERRVAHLCAGAQATDAIERVRHRALAAESSDPELVAELVAAADLAKRRGAPEAAGDLTQLAALQAADPEVQAELLVRAAEYARDAGLTDEGRARCRQALELGEPRTRAAARLVLFDLAGQDLTGIGTELERASDEAGTDSALQAQILRRRAELLVRSGRVSSGLKLLTEVERQAELASDIDSAAAALMIRLALEVSSSPDREAELMAEAARLTARAPLSEAVTTARLAVLMAHLRRGNVETALDGVLALRAEVESAGRIRELCVVLYCEAVIGDRAGYCLQAAEAAEGAARLRLDVDPSPLPGLTIRAMAELGHGRLEQAEGVVARALTSPDQTRPDPEWLAYAAGVRGRIALLQEQNQDAAESLLRCRQGLDALGFADPALFVVDADLAEALALAGETTEATRVIDAARIRAKAHGRWVVDLGLRRAEAIVEAHTGDARSAADELRSSMPDEHPYPLELARAWLVLGGLERRARRRTAARIAVLEAGRRFRMADCLPWQRRAEAELARLDSAHTPLSELEQQIVASVVAGRTNRQIAADLHLSVKAIEANLTRIYRKLGVRTRRELGAG